jgi:hypothetical protein
MNPAWQCLLNSGDVSLLHGKLQDRQISWLLSCLKRNRMTHYGRLFGFETISSVDGYRARVPLKSYDEIFPWIERIVHGERDILFKGVPVAFEQTGGSSGGSKLIPYSLESLHDFRVAIRPWLANVVAVHGLGRGCAYLAVSPSARRSEALSSTIPLGLHDGAYLGSDAMHALSELSAVPSWVKEVSCLTDWQLITLYWLVKRHDLEMISVWSPTFFLSLMAALLQRITELEGLLLHGGTFCSHRLEPDFMALHRLIAYKKGNNARILWPYLRFVSCWKDGASKSFFDELKARLPHAVFQAKGLLSTEGVVTIPDAENYPILAADSGFFEFLDHDGSLLLAHELVKDSVYEVVMTTSGGLYRYRTGDSVFFEDFRSSIPVLRFLGRNGLVSDLVGEKLTDEFVALCLEGVAGFHLLVPCYRPEPGYVLILDNLYHELLDTGLADAVEHKLFANPQYAYARQMGQLGKLSLLFVKAPVEAYINRIVKNGARLGDIKISALRPEQDWVETFLGEVS